MIIPARKIHPGMHVRLTPDGQIWTVLDKHPTLGHWWLHCRIDGRWVTTSSHYRKMEQVI